MSRIAPSIVLTTDERQTLELWSRSGKTEQRVAFRSKIILKAAQGLENRQIAAEMGTRQATISKWRCRFSEQRLPGLQDAPRPGAAPKYDQQTERRILEMLDEPPPRGYATWTGPLLAQALGDVSDDHVWRVLRKYGISLARRRS
ncbi:MAG: helix-turn-helix domain-containing protein [Desulfobacterales bacterium]|nr:helix-turn-helix domain-containing protein [Desulfobacterales bacterium]